MAMAGLRQSVECISRAPPLCIGKRETWRNDLVFTWRNAHGGYLFPIKCGMGLKSTRHGSGILSATTAFLRIITPWKRKFAEWKYRLSMGNRRIRKVKFDLLKERGRARQTEGGVVTFREFVIQSSEAYRSIIRILHSLYPSKACSIRNPVRENQNPRLWPFQV